jgi:hypothetical protein
MFSYRLLTDHVGPMLISDSATWSCLHEITRDISSRTWFLQDKVELLALALDARKAAEGQRTVLPPPDDFPVWGTYHGAEMSWPVLLVQVRMLRVALGFIDHSKRHQAIVYALEPVPHYAISVASGPSPRGLSSTCPPTGSM